MKYYDTIENTFITNHNKSLMILISTQDITLHKKTKVKTIVCLYYTYWLSNGSISLSLFKCLQLYVS